MEIQIMEIENSILILLVTFPVKRSIVYIRYQFRKYVFKGNDQGKGYGG